MDYWIGLYFLNFLNVVFSAPDASYTVHLDYYSFEEAQAFCKSAGNGILTDMAKPQETEKILKAIEDKRNETLTSFWIGLKKDRLECVQANLPLKGFSWIVDNSTEFEADKWKSEPKGTCTTVLCGLLSVKYSGSAIESWLLDSGRCKQTHPFICKREGQTEEKPCPGPSINGSFDSMQKRTDPYTLRVTCKNKKTFTLTCSATTHEWTLVNSPKTDISQLCLECEKGYKKNAQGNCVDVDECKLQPCKHCINTVGSYVCKCPDGTEVTDENCKTDDTDFQEKTSLSSVEKTPQPDSTTESSVHIEGSTGDPSNIIFPVIIALLIFVVLVVIMAGIVKCCLIRCSKKRAKKRAEASKESMALNGSDSMEKVNEKEVF